MGVLKSKRKESQLFVYDTYRKYATELLRTLSACLSAERFKNLNNFQLRFFDREIFYLQDDLHNIANEILQANSIYPTNESEYKERRNHQTSAIGYCHSIQNDIISVFDLESDCMKPILHIANDFNSLEGLLKKWRKANKKVTV